MKVKLNECLTKLNNKEKFLFKLMYSNAGVLFLKGKPGIGKSAIANSIAKKLDFNYIDLRLAQIDETELGLFPVVKNEKSHDYIKYALPEWAILANSKPSIIHFEELNRSPLHIRNAALQILNERGIGHLFKFNENVFFISSGNIGVDDGTEVEEFDSALKTRLLTINYDLSLSEWLECFANENVNPYILNFLNAKPGEYYKFSSEGNTFATPRGWTYLSDYIKNVVEDNKNAKEILNSVYSVADLFVGVSTSHAFLRYLEDSVQINVKDILNRYDNVKSLVNQLGDVKKTELTEDLKLLPFDDFTSEQLSNIQKFLNDIQEDQKAGYLLHIIDRVPKDKWKNSSVRTFVQPYKKLLLKMADKEK